MGSSCDFNVILDASEWTGRSPHVHKGCGLFEHFIFEHGLQDLGCVRSRYTWSREGLSQRLDRALCNTKWDKCFPSYCIRNLHSLKFDHRPILVSLSTVRSNGNHPFPCLDSWMHHRDFSSLVQHNWHGEAPVVASLAQPRSAILVWNKEIYGNIFERKKRLVPELILVQWVLEWRFSNKLRQREWEIH